MADNLKYNEPGSGPLVATDDVGSTHYQVMKVNLGGDGTSIPVDGKIPVTIVSGTGIILAASAANIGDVDIASPLGPGTEGAAVRVTLATDSTGLVSVDDNGASLTVDAADLDIRDLVPATDHVGARLKDASGADFGTSGNPVRVKVSVNGSDGDTFTPNSSDGFPMMGAREDSSPSTLAEDDVGIIRATQARALHVNFRNDTGTEIGTASNPVRVDPTNTTAQEVNQGLGSSAVADAWLMSGTINISNIQTDATIKFVRVNATADGDNSIISGVTGKKIRVLGYVITVTTAGTVTMQDTAGSPNIFAQFSLLAQGGASYAGGLMCPAFETLVGNGVEINTQTGQDCLGHMTYIEV